MNRQLHGQIAMDLLTGSGLSYELPVRLSFSVLRPWAVDLTFMLAGDSAVTWTLSRELLLDGLSQATGDGDVRIGPVDWLSGDAVSIQLRVPDGEAELRAPLAALHAFLLRTDLLVPFGDEFPDEFIERGIARLMHPAAARVRR